MTYAAWLLIAIAGAVVEVWLAVSILTTPRHQYENVLLFVGLTLAALGLTLAALMGVDVVRAWRDE